ncbi:MAG: Rossmann-like domain-containing protein [Candidatus Xenobiia bacterium LiM19]
MYTKLKKEFAKVAEGMMNENVSIISAKTLTAKQAIGTPDRDDFPLLKGKEVMIEASFKDAGGHAFTDEPGRFIGVLSDIIQLPLKDNFQRAVFTASFNAVMRCLGLVEGTIHCRDKEPASCALQLVETVKERFGNPRISFVGFQPAMIERLAGAFSVRVLDLDKDNIGKEKFNLVIEGPEATEDVLSWGDVIIATGSTCVNATITEFLGRKPVVFYGVTVAAAAKVCGFDRYCPHAH